MEAPTFSLLLLQEPLHLKDGHDANLLTNLGFQFFPNEKITSRKNKQSHWITIVLIPLASSLQRLQYLV